MNHFAILVECDPGKTLGGSCTRDINNLAQHLVNRCHFDPSKIYTLSTNQNTDTIGQKGCSIEFFKYIDQIMDQKPELIIILLSGHGFSVFDTDGDEIDHQDEAINVGRLIIDDEIYERLVHKLTCPAVLLADTCHSGTMFDLPYIYQNHMWVSASNRKLSETLHPKIMGWSACSDQQLSMCDVGDKTGFGGSLTTSILNIDNVLEDIILMKNLGETHQKIQKRLSSLNQTLIFSSSSKDIVLK